MSKHAIGIVERIDDYEAALAEMYLLAEVELESRIRNGRPDPKLYAATSNAIIECERASRRLVRTIGRLYQRGELSLG